MQTIIILSSFATLMLILSIFLFFGKGSWLIAGYNTASAEEKAKYNKKKLCRTMSVVMFVISILLYIMAFIDESLMMPFTFIFVVVVFTTIGVALYYANTKCKN